MKWNANKTHMKFRWVETNDEPKLIAELRKKCFLPIGFVDWIFKSKNIIKYNSEGVCEWPKDLAMKYSKDLDGTDLYSEPTVLLTSS